MENNVEKEKTEIVVLAAVAHPDDIEFMMAGTMLQLADRGAQIHFWNLANGCCGTATESKEAIVKIRAAEVETSAKLAGAVVHAPLFDDLCVFYDQDSLACVSAVVREIQPTIILTHAPNDYMEDHKNVCRLITTAAFSRGMAPYITKPPRQPWQAPVALYHGFPHGLKDPVGRLVEADCFVDTSAVISRKEALLSCHTSQKEWLDVSQGMNAYLREMERMSLEAGRLSTCFEHAEGWIRHNPLGFSSQNFNPMKELLKGDYHEASNQ